MQKLLLPVICFATLMSCSQSSTSQITLRNTSSRDRVDEAFVISREQLNCSNKYLLPALKDADGNWVASQVDDMDGDKSWDELAFVCDIDANETLRLDVEWVSAEEYPEFKARTNVRFGVLNEQGILTEPKVVSHGKENLPRASKTFQHPYQMEGPAWESDKMGFRNYFDGRNCRDVFAKRTDEMVLDYVGVSEAGKPKNTYHADSDWGRDIMSASNSFGLGGIAIKSADTLMLLGVAPKYTTDNIEKSTYRLVSEGPVRSILSLEFEGWAVGGKSVDLRDEITIWAGKYGYENKVSTSKLPKGFELVTGIIADNNDMPYREERYSDSYISMNTHDKQTYGKKWYMGMSLILPAENYVETFDAPMEGGDILDTWCVTLKPDADGFYRYNAYATWEISDERFADADYYYSLIDTYGENLSEPVEVAVK